MKNGKRLLIGLLALVLCALPMGVLAEGLEVVSDEHFLDSEVMAEATEPEIPEEEYTIDGAAATEGGGYADFVWNGTEADESEIAASSDFVIDENGVLTKYLGFDKDVVIPDGITAIGWEVFAYNEQAETITIPDSVISIGHWAFHDCKKLRSISIPDSVAGMSDNWFQSCSALEEVHLSQNITDISSYMFAGCRSLKNIDIPSRVTSIGEAAFSYSGITSIAIPEGVTKLTGRLSGVFECCYNLESITIPSSVAEMSQNTFNSCGKVVIRGEAGSYAERFANAMGIPFNAPIVSFENKTKLIRVGQSTTLNAIQTPADLSRELSWSSSNPSIVSVDQSGTITAIAPGEATVTASTADGKGKPGEIKITVPKIATISIYGPGERIRKGSTAYAYVDVSTGYYPGEYDENDKALMTPSWSVSDPDILSISEDWDSPSPDRKQLIAQKPGKVTLSVTTGDTGKAEMEIEVYEPEPEEISLNVSGTSTLKPGKTLQLSARLYPEDAVSTLIWTSSEPKVAKVDQNGKVTPVGPGLTWITVGTSNGKAVSTDVVVPKVEPKKVKIKQGKKATLKVGKKLSLKAVLSPAGSSSKLTWTSSNKKIATVSKTGKVTAKKPGKVKITVKTKKGKKATITITVKKK